MTCFRKNTLYVILPYFNFCGFKRRHELFMNFVIEISKIKNIKIIVSELIGPTPIGKLKAWKHLKFNSNDRLWVKENLINKGIESLPKDWEHVAWIDADIQFLNGRWVEDTIHELQKCDLVQLWQSAVNLGPCGETLKVDKSFGFMSGQGGSPTKVYDNWHPGYAWACNRRFYNRVGALIDWAILGSADRHMAMAMIGKILQSGPGNMHPHYMDMLEEFQTRVKGLHLGWITGTIIHQWHGSFENRRYKERWRILTDNKYDPSLDIGTTREGIIELTTRGKRLEPYINEYFTGRQEDS